MKICKECKRELNDFSFRTCSRCLYRRRKWGSIIHPPPKFCQDCKVSIQNKHINSIRCDECAKIKIFTDARKRKGISLDKPRKNPKGKARYKSAYGYIVLNIKGHPNASSNGVIAEHTFIMSQHLGRPLTKGENVHHKNGIRDDNRIENLELWTRRQPTGQRVEDKIKWAKEFLEEYGHKVLLSS